MSKHKSRRRIRQAHKEAGRLYLTDKELRRSDPYLSRATADMDTWLVLERALCRCEDVCSCDWDRA